MSAVPDDVRSLAQTAADAGLRHGITGDRPSLRDLIADAIMADRASQLAPEGQNAEASLRAALGRVHAEAKSANDVIRLNRNGDGNGRVKVATAMHRIEAYAAAALATAPAVPDGRTEEA